MRAAIAFAALVALAACAPQPGASAPLAAAPELEAPAPSASSSVIDPVTAQPRPVIDVPVAPAEPHAPVPVPATLTVDRLDIAMPVEGVGLEPDGAMVIPDSADVAGWYRRGGHPGGGVRADMTAVMAAHVDDAVIGLGPFARLRDARVGDEVAVTLTDGSSVRYVVERVEQTSKREVDIAQALAGAEGGLVLVTCGGAWDAEARHYEDNVLVWAVPGVQA